MDNYQEIATVRIEVSVGPIETLALVYPMAIPAQHSISDLIYALQRSIVMMAPQPKLERIDE